MTKVFVYGTLKRGWGNSRLIPEDLTPTPDSIRGYTMYHMGGFPGIVNTPETSRMVVGEVFEVDDATLRRLDSLEGYRGEGEHNFYERERVVTDNGEECLVYVQSSAPSDSVVESGEWTR